jgi:hypothetical protein
MMDFRLGKKSQITDETNPGFTSPGRKRTIPTIMARNTSDKSVIIYGMYNPIFNHL